MIMKKIYLFLLLFTSASLYADQVYGPFEYKRLNSEPVHWYPEEGIFNSTIYLNLSSDYGKIYYIINKSFNKEEPIEYKGQILLQGKDKAVVDYNVVAILEKEDGSIELYSRTYRIDNTQKYEKKDYSVKTYYKKNVTYNEDKINIIYEFNNNNYGLNYGKREFKFPVEIVANDNVKKEIILKGKDLDDSLFLVNCSYNKDGKVYTEIHTYSLDLGKPEPPSFGSLFWGQYYKQNYKIRIKPADSNDTIYYWLREWKNDELIVAPPLQDKINSWIKYSEPVDIKSKYGKDGIIGIAAFSLGKNNKVSNISGPFYFKISDINNTIEQVFENEIEIPANKKVVLLNNNEFENKIYNVKGKATLKFENFNKDDMFYFTFKGKKGEGKSELIPCEKEFIFTNNNLDPVEIDVFLTNGIKLGSLIIAGESMIYPVLKNYLGNYVDLSSDMIIDFYMPKNKVKYEFTTNIYKYLEITEKSNDFTGSIKVNARDGEEITYRIKFGAFDDGNRLIGESEDYYFRIDKKFPQEDVSSDSINFNIYHNEKQILKLIKPENNGKIYYRLSMDYNWTLYEEPIIFFPPLIGKCSADIYTKFVDEADNERENKEPFKIMFDTRGIFVNEKENYSGNGTEVSPYNSINRAIEFAKRKNIKLIYLVSDTINSTYPIIVDSDIIIQPYNKDKRPIMVLDSKSIFTKNHKCFDITEKGYLEIRNVDFIINSGKYFSEVTDSKIKLYNLQFSYNSEDDFSLIENKNGKVGIYNLILNISSTPENFSFLNTKNSTNIIKNVLIKGKVLNSSIFNIEKSDYFILENINIEISSDEKSKFANIINSSVSIDKLIYKQTGNFKNLTLFDVNNSSLYLKGSNFFAEGNNPFEIIALNEKNSKANIIESLFWFKKSSSVIGFNLNNSDIVFERSIINVQDVLDFAYNFRAINSNLDLRSSVMRNINCGSSVSFVLDDCNFKSVNNSVFNVNINIRSFNFWITDKSEITTVNSIYYFNEKNDNAFIYLNNINYEQLKPVWYSNIISTNNILLENLEKKDLDFIIKDFSEKNIFYNFTNEFDILSDQFFVPIADSLILQGGLPEYSSPLAIPEKDFFGKNRIIPGIGIDLGAVQKSGNF